MATPVDLGPEQLLRRLEWTVLRPLDGRLQGDYRTLFRGSGVDFRDLREYAPGDDVRRIDWNVTARLNTPYVREYSEDREITAWLLLDRSASMGFGPVDRSKDVVLVEFATVLARVLTRGGNRIGALVYDASVERTLPPRNGRDQVLHLIYELHRDRRPGGAPTDLAGLLNAANSLIRRRSLIVLISDFISAPGWERPLQLLAEHHDVLAIHLLDPLERDVPDVGVIVIEDTETGEQVVVDTGDAEFRRRLAGLADAQNQQLRAAAISAGVDLHTVSTNESLIGAFLRIAGARKRRRR